MFEHLLNLRPLKIPRRHVRPTACTRKASPVLRHSESAIPEFMCDTPRGNRAYLCAKCAGYVRAEEYAKTRLEKPLSASQVLALTLVMMADRGYTAPPPTEPMTSHLCFTLRYLETCGLIKSVRLDNTKDARQPVDLRWVMHDACVGCLSRTECTDDCPVKFGPEFAERTDQLKGARLW